MSTIPMPTGPSNDDFSNEAVQQRILASSIAYCFDHNKAETIQYLGTTYPRWAVNIDAGKATYMDSSSPSYMPPPPPPFKWVLSKPDKDGYIFYERSTTELVCDMPTPLPVDRMAQSVNVLTPKPDAKNGITVVGDPWDASLMNFKAFTGPADNPTAVDTRPAGYKTQIQGPDGAAINLQKVMSPWGNHYERV